MGLLHRYRRGDFDAPLDDLLIWAFQTLLPKPLRERNAAWLLARQVRRYTLMENL